MTTSPPRPEVAVGAIPGELCRRLSIEAEVAELPVLDRLSYLNTGTFGPLPRPTTEVMVAEQLTELGPEDEDVHLLRALSAVKAGDFAKVAAAQ